MAEARRMEHAPSSLRAEAREMVSRGIASSQGRKLKGESEEGEHQGGCAGHRRVLSGRRSGGKGNGEERKRREGKGKVGVTVSSTSQGTLPPALSVPVPTSQLPSLIPLGSLRDSPCPSQNPTEAFFPARLSTSEFSRPPRIRSLSTQALLLFPAGPGLAHVCAPNPFCRESSTSRVSSLPLAESATSTFRFRGESPLYWSALQD